MERESTLKQSLSGRKVTWLIVLANKAELRSQPEFILFKLYCFSLMPKLCQPLSESKYEACPKSPAIVI